MRIYIPNRTQYPPEFVRSQNATSQRDRIVWRSPSLAERGREHWAKLHTLARDRSLTPESLAEWESAIPSFGCDCAAKYSKLKAANPPRFDDPFQWSVEIHNSVNSDLGKPSVSLAEAYRIWSNP